MWKKTVWSSSNTLLWFDKTTLILPQYKKIPWKVEWKNYISRTFLMDQCIQTLDSEKEKNIIYQTDKQLFQVIFENWLNYRPSDVCIP